MKILVLDDDDVRHGMFAEAFDALCVHAWSFSEFKAAILHAAHLPFTHVFLDHDLDDLRPAQLDADGNPLTGLDAAQLITTLPGRQRHIHVIIHSTNDHGSERMLSALRAGGVYATRQKYQPGMTPRQALSPDLPLPPKDREV